MLMIYDVILEWLEGMPSVVRAIGGCDAHLADQLRRSSTSVALNVAEGMGATGRVKTNSYRIALREMRESMAAVEIAVRLGYTTRPDASASDRQQRIVATLIKLAKPQG